MCPHSGIVVHVVYPAGTAYHLYIVGRAELLVEGEDALKLLVVNVFLLYACLSVVGGPHGGVAVEVTLVLVVFTACGVLHAGLQEGEGVYFGIQRNVVVVHVYVVVLVHGFIVNLFHAGVTAEHVLALNCVEGICKEHPVNDVGGGAIRTGAEVGALCGGQVGVYSHPEPVCGGEVRVYTGAGAAEVGVHHKAFVGGVHKACGGPYLVVAALNVHGVGLCKGGTGHLLDPVRARALEGLLFLSVRRVTSAAVLTPHVHVEVNFVFGVHELPGILQDLCRKIIGIIHGEAPCGSLLCGDEDDAVGAARSVNRRCGGVLEDFYALNVLRAHLVANVALDSVHYI